MGRITKCRRYVIDVTGLDPVSSRKLGGFQYFGKFGASGFHPSLRGKGCKLWNSPIIYI